jgi:nucleoside-diphosphate-sugar epimerase
LYGITKVGAERNILEAGNAISFRLATVFGSSPRPRTDLLVNDFVYRAINDGFVILFGAHATRNYIHILDVVDTFIYGIKNWESMKDNVYNVGLSSANLSKLELCEKIKKHLPKFVYMEAEIGEDPDRRDYLISNAKLENKGWCARRSLDDGIRELIKAYQIIKNNKYGNV